MNRRIYAVYRQGHIPDELTKLLGSRLNGLLSLGPTIKIRARQGVHIELEEGTKYFDQQLTEKIYPLTGAKLNLMTLDPKPEIEIVLGD